MASNFRLVIRSGPSAGKVYNIEKEEAVIGRDLNNEIVISDPEVSRRHARLFLQGTNYVLEDLGSTNGTFVNGQRLMGPYVLRPGEVITLGEHINLEFETVQYDPDATMASSSVRPQPVASSNMPPRYTPPPVTPAPPQQQQQQPVPMPAYRQPVPTAEYEEPYIPERRRFPSWAIILIVVILFLVCVCGVILYVIDARNLWCDLLPFLFSACQ